MAEVPRIPILLLGDAGVGKSTFLARLQLGTSGASEGQRRLPAVRDLDQPFRFDVRMYNRPYSFEFYDTASPTHYTLLRPAVIVFCFDIARPASLHSVRTHWTRVAEEHFTHDETLPVILLGLGRDVRQREDYDGRVRGTGSDEVDGEAADLRPRTFLYPQEAMLVAQEIYADRYCECSALTGELCREVFEDISRTAALTTTDKGGKTASGCATM